MSTIDQLRARLDRDWPAIRAARVKAAEAAQRLEQVRHDASGAGTIDSDDVSIVVFGSLARDEWTAGSDLDWTLLIDGGAHHEHALAAQHLARYLGRAGFRLPGATGVFGNMAFSHNIIHQIGGPDDSNRNTTQRLLLLLESKTIGHPGAYERVIRSILQRYLDNDTVLGVRPPEPFAYKVPRFLYNDIDRYWRTMCVDYASKYRDRAGQGWALRHAKLRLSRKLVFVSGILACFFCDRQLLEEVGQPPPDEPGVEDLVNHLAEYVRRPPLAVVAEALAHFARPDTARLLLDAYDAFLARMNDPEVRQRLNDLGPADADADACFQDCQAIGRRFQSGLKQLFFRDHERLFELVQEYGVF